MLVSLIHISRKVVDTLRWVFQAEKKRVRKLDLGGHSSQYVYGTVEKRHQVQMTNVPGFVEHWTIVWDDTPYLWETRPAHSFIWHDGVHTLLSK